MAAGSDQTLVSCVDFECVRTLLVACACVCFPVQNPPDPQLSIKHQQEFDFHPSERQNSVFVASSKAHGRAEINDMNTTVLLF